MNPQMFDFMVNTAYHLGKKHTLEAIGNMVPGVLDEAIGLAEKKFQENNSKLPEELQEHFNSFDKNISLTILTGMWDTVTGDEGEAA